jgi:hypothetical protein
LNQPKRRPSLARIGRYFGFIAARGTINRETCGGIGAI